MKQLHGLILRLPRYPAAVSRNAHCGTPLGAQDFLRNSRKFGKIGEKFRETATDKLQSQLQRANFISIMKFSIDKRSK